jgi:hypothetical protein
VTSPQTFPDEERLAHIALFPENPLICKYGSKHHTDDEAIGLLEQFLANDRRRALTLEFFQPIEKDCGTSLARTFAIPCGSVGTMRSKMTLPVSSAMQIAVSFQ